MSILLIGLNHRTAPVQVRERLAFSREGIATALMLFHKQYPDCEAAILSTCNRVEVLLNSESNEVGLKQVIKFLAQTRNVAADDFASHLDQFEGSDAVRQVFRIIGGLDSMVLGEYQIVNQLKQAYQLAHEQSTTGAVLNRLFHHAFGVSKRIRTETTISDGKTSIPSVAVDVIRDEDPDFTNRRILIVGAGEMAQQAAQYLRAAHATQFAICTRTLTNARALADVCGGEAVPFSDLESELTKADIVITATNCPMALVTVDRIGRAQAARGNRPLLLIDLAVPRNVEPEVGTLPEIRLHDVDSLGRIVAENRRQRTAQAETCEQIIEEETNAFNEWVAQSKVRPLIEQMFEDVRALAEIEVRSMFRRCPDLSDPQRQAVEQLADRIVNKLMHPCVCAVRQEGMSGSDLAEAFHATRLNHNAGSASRTTCLTETAA